jgi:hypothetical protein
MVLHTESFAMFPIRKWLSARGLRPTAAEPVSTVGDEQSIPMPQGCYLIDEREAVVNFPIDAVYTWVDRTDDSFKEAIKRFRPSAPNSDPSLYESNDELRYSLRSLETYAPWINHVYIVTNGQRPSWLVETSKVSIIHHSEILDRQYLPTFNSHVIESALHNIPGLAERYVYFNDDMFLLNATRQADFFTGSGLAYAFIGSVELPDDPPLLNETATNWGAKNARALVTRKWRPAPKRRLAHIASPQIKSVGSLCEHLFSDEYHAFRANRFRSINDLLVTGYLNPVAGYFQGKFLFAHTNWWYVKIRERSAPRIYRAILAEKNQPRNRKFGCFNDQPFSKSNSQNAGYQCRGFLEEYFDIPSSFERRA